MLSEVLKAFTEFTDGASQAVAEDEDVLSAMLETSDLDVLVGPFVATSPEDSKED